MPPYRFQMVIGGRPADLSEEIVDAFLQLLPDSAVLQRLKQTGSAVLAAPSEELETFRHEVEGVDSPTGRQLYAGRTLFAHLIHLRSIVGLVAVPGVT